jgi:hypothetical protein
MKFIGLLELLGFIGFIEFIGFIGLEVRGPLALWNTGCVVTLSYGSILPSYAESHACVL